MRPNRLRELRMRACLTQAEVAKLIDVSVSLVAKHESGNRPPSKQEIIKYARLYKVETYELFLEPVALDQAADERHGPVPPAMLRQLETATP